MQNFNQTSLNELILVVDTLNGGVLKYYHENTSGICKLFMHSAFNFVNSKQITLFASVVIFQHLRH